MKKFYIATAIPYVNALPHIGNALDYTLADALSRYYQIQGYSVFFSTGSDEHGQKIAEKAAEQHKSPQAYTDEMVPGWKDFAKALDINYSYWIRTTEPKHIKAADYAWKKLAPYIYKKDYTSWYCVGHEEFVTETTYKANKGICPDHNKPYEKVTEQNYFFKLTEFGTRIKEALAKDEYKIYPASRKNEVMALLNEGLEDISVSREAKRLKWGIPVPGDPSQVMYVWFEALLNYLSTLDYPNGENFKTFWPCDIQIVGKDIIRFHAVIWPALLMGLELPLPKSLLVHGHIQVANQKMSKTIGNVVSPLDIVKDYGIDPFRYFFLRHIPTQNDGDFTWERFEDAYNNELGNELGNLVQRVAAMINRYQEGVIGSIPEAAHDIVPYHEAIAELRLDKALDYVWLLVKGLNQYIDEEKPWEIAKAEDGQHLQEVLAYLVSSLLQVSDLLLPFLPNTAVVIKETFEKEVVKPYEGVLFPKIYLHTKDPSGRKHDAH